VLTDDRWASTLLAADSSEGALEQEQAVREHSRLRQRASQILGNGSEILPDHQAAMTLAFERENAE
jgi:hypothetical protein